MAKRTRSKDADAARGRELFPSLALRRRRPLFLDRFLSEEAEKVLYRGDRQDRAFEIVGEWAELDKQGHLRRKETSLDADFLQRIFGDALGYKAATQSPKAFQWQRSYTVPGTGTADGALGSFHPGNGTPNAVIELKGARTDLDRDKFNGRTPVQQCWDYLNALPDCPWGIVSNFTTIRLYHRDKTPLAFEEFRLQDLTDRKRFNKFYCLFEVGGLLTTALGTPRALRLLERSETRQREVGDELYAAYQQQRHALVAHLHFERGKPLELAINITQKIIDRIVFIAFCEDRNLLPERCLERAYREIAPFAKVTNPRWQNFLGLFHAVDQGRNAVLGLQQGYNGGLFRHDPEVDDLELDDSWTNFFRSVGTYDFRDEVSVDVLGHLFERSITDLHRLRTGGLFGGERRAPAMPKSAERKRTGTYYTPADFTALVVETTLGDLVDARIADLRANRRLPADLADSDQVAPKALKFWREAFELVRGVKVCDPACGSGAFLIRAYDALEERYVRIVDQIHRAAPTVAEELAAQIPEIILRDNLFGVDLSPEAVEITQLALWIRSARRGKTLADLSENIRCGNSLVSDPQLDPRAVDWPALFPQAFARADEPGFDCVIGNPPWERLKLQEREFFADSAPDIAAAVSAATRRKLIADLETGEPELFALYRQAIADADRNLTYARTSDRYPLTGRGDVNTYSLFAELSAALVAPRGRVGLLVPSGIATDATTREFFGALVDSGRLMRLYDFENRRKIFADVDGRFKFSVFVFGGAATAVSAADFAFFLHAVEQLEERDRHIALTRDDIGRLNPNTRTCPIFRSNRDAALTRKIYDRVPVLVDKRRKEGGNPWGASFLRMFDQTNDAELFRTADDLQREGFALRGNRWVRRRETYLPLYEAKMIQAYDHRAASVVVESSNWMRQGQTQATTLVSHQNLEYYATPRWWAPESAVDKVLSGRVRSAYVAFKDVTSPTNQRTMIAAFVPHVGLLNSAPLMLLDDSLGQRLTCCMLANLNSFALDFVARQKVGGIHLNFFIVEQLPTFTPDDFRQRCPWSSRQTLERWVSDRVLKLTCTAEDMRPLAEEAGMKEPVHRWDPRERARLRAELDAAFFHLYGLSADDADYVLGTFSTADEQTPDLFGGKSARGLILEAMADLATKSR